MAKLHSAFVLGGNTLPIGIIRYNPDPFQVNGKTKKMLKHDRESKLLEVVNSWTFGEPGSVEIQYMYYDAKQSNNDRPSLNIWEDPLYDLIVQGCCWDPIV